MCAWSARQTSRPARQLNVIGLGVMLLGAILAWAMLAQALSGFTLPSPPLLALQAITLGMALLIPIHAPRVIDDGPGRRSRPSAGSGSPRIPSENGVLPRRLRRPAVLYVAVTAPLAGLAGLVVHGQAAFLLAWVYVSAVYTTPAMITTWAASRRTRYQTDAWRVVPRDRRAVPERRRPAPHRAVPRARRSSAWRSSPSCRASCSSAARRSP